MQWCKADHGHGTRVTDEGEVVLAGKAIDDLVGLSNTGGAAAGCAGKVINDARA
jgi:hypothetical protein